jgi:hypothetical protein
MYLACLGVRAKARISDEEARNVHTVSCGNPEANRTFHAQHQISQKTRVKGTRRRNPASAGKLRQCQTTDDLGR